MSLSTLSLFGFLVQAALNCIIIIECKNCEIPAKIKLFIGLKDTNLPAMYFQPGDIVNIVAEYNISEMNPDGVQLEWYSKRLNEQNGPIWTAFRKGGVKSSYGDLPGGSGSDIDDLPQRFTLTFPMPVYDDVYFYRLTYWCGDRESEALRSPENKVKLTLKDSDLAVPVLRLQFKAGVSSTGGSALKKDDVIALTCYSQAPHHYIDEIEFTFFIGDEVLHTQSLPACEKEKCPRDWLAARGRPSFQSSYVGGSNPFMAVDGKRNTCTRTGSEDNPWWVIELEFDTYVHNVKITNTATGDSHLRIGVTQTSPQDNAPSMQNIYICAKKNNPLFGTETFSCEAYGKYLAIINEATNSVLNLCDVEIESRQHAKVITHVTVKPEYHNKPWKCKSMWPLWTPNDYEDHFSSTVSYEVVWLPTKLDISHDVAGDGAVPGITASITCEHNTANPPLDITWSHSGFAPDFKMLHSDGTPKNRNIAGIHLGKYNIQSGRRLGGQVHGQLTTSILSFTVELTDSEHKYFCYIEGPQQSAILQNFTSFHVNEVSTSATATMPVEQGNRTTTDAAAREAPKKGVERPRNPLPYILGIFFGIAVLVCTAVIVGVLWRRSIQNENKAADQVKAIKP